MTKYQTYYPPFRLRHSRVMIHYHFEFNFYYRAKNNEFACEEVSPKQVNIRETKVRIFI